MPVQPRRILGVIALLSLLISSSGVMPLALAEDPSAEIQGRSLQYWVNKAAEAADDAAIAEVVKALSEAVSQDDPSTKAIAADALATLGPKASEAVPTLLDQLNHEFPWVRVACQAALGSVGKEAVPALMDTVENQTGGPRIRAAFILGGIGPDAKEAIPVLLKVMQQETPVMQVRFKGILGQIDPARFPPKSATSKATFDANEAGAAAAPEDVGSADWPQFHGPRRDSLCSDTGLLQAWPEGGPKQLWTLKGLGRGYSTVSIADRTIYTMGDRATDQGPEEAQFVLAYDLQTRKSLWKTAIGPPHGDGGPRCTPTVDGDLVYVIGTDSDVVCLDASTGAVKWKRNLAQEFDGKMMSVWKYSESPLIDGDRLICTPGGPEATMVALNKHTGATLWKCATPEIGQDGADGAAYSSAVAATICDVPQYVQVFGRGVVGVHAETGKFLWGYNHVANNVANITMPVVRGNYVFATTAYSTGAVLLRITCDGDKWDAQEVYFLKGRDFQNHHGGVVLLGDYVYGGHGPNKGDPACVELGTGEVKWRQRAPARGSASVVYADGHIIFRYDRGEVVLVEASPEAFKIKGRFTAPTAAGPAWAHPVVHGGKLYLRHEDILLCYDLRSFE
jgi:outer membrane protein assembly factor BamB